MQIIRSPFFYVGDKYKLMPQLKCLFPTNIDTYFEPFCGGGSSFLNTEARQYVSNDVDYYVIALHKFFQANKDTPNAFLDKLFEIINKYNLSCSYKGITAPEELKKAFVKTYYARFNKDAYFKLRADFNAQQDNFYLLYLLLIYGFNHMIRFNSKGDFNLPVGNVDFNNNVFMAINNYFEFLRKHEIHFTNMDFVKFLNSQDFKENDFVFCDPPYLISQSEYNKLWSDVEEFKLYEELDKLDERGVKFGLTNLLLHKGQKNEILSDWMKKYKVYYISSNYISFNDNTIKKNSQEVYVTNG